MSEYRFQLAGYAPERGTAVVDIESLSPEQRMGRAFKGAGMWLLAGVVSVFIPIAHFVLVPLCLVGAFVMGFVRFTQKALVTRAHGRCPDCGAEQDLDLIGPWRGPSDLVCRGCQRPLRMVPES